MKKIIIILLLASVSFAANEIHYLDIAGQTNLYVRVVKASGLTIWDGDSYEASPAWEDTDIALTENTSIKGLYYATMPTSAVGRYYVMAYAGAVPADTDVRLQAWEMDWSGSAEITLASTLTANVAQIEGTDVTDFFTTMNAIATDWLNGGRLDLLIDAIKAKTDLLPAYPAAVDDGL